MGAQPPARAPRRRVDGILLLDKPAGVSSNAALQRARRALRAEKAGHTGTLDPLASGLLPLCFGEATKFAQSLLDARKEYVATIRFGIATTTGDAEGEVCATSAADVSTEAIEAVLPRFTGRILQLPPRHAALKYRGRNYYEYAREGVEIPRTPREVTVEAIEVLDVSPPTARIRVACSKGTYIRVLAEDIGRAAGSCAHLAALRRTASGPFRIDGAITLADAEASDPGDLDARLLAVDAALVEMPRFDVDAAGERALTQGRRVPVGTKDTDATVRCYGPTRGFLGLATIRAGELRPLRMASA